MSVADLPQCVQDCLKPAAEKAGCSDDDLHCLCTKDVDASIGLSVGICVVGNPLSLGDNSGSCKGSTLSLYGDLTAICNRAAASASSSTSGSTQSTTLRTSAKTDTTIATSSINTSSSLLSTPSPQASSSTGSDAASATDSESSGSSSQLSTGTAVGIGVGAAFLFMILAIGLFLLWRRKRKRQRTAPNSENDENKTAEVSGKPVVDAELPGSSPQHELYGETTHATEMNSHTRISNSNGPIIPMKEAQNANVVYELPADQSSANVQGK